jgi:hypothetical protein
MNNELVVHEKYSRYWPVVALLSVVFTLIFFIAYQIVSDVLIEGYLRLTAFSFFALSVLSLFKVKDGKMEITLTEKLNLLNITYKVRDRIVHSEDLNIELIKEVETTQMPNRSLYNDFMKSDRCIKFKRKNSDDWLYLHEINGRVIPLSRDNAEAIVNYIENQRNN